MSEFTETMHDTAVRLSAGRCGNGCDGCPAALWRDSNGACLIRRIAKIGNAEEQVINLQNWAAEHPEPVYPSWEEGWRQLFPEADIRRTFCPETFGDKYRCDWCQDDNDNCDECLERPMPAEVAEKLGIKPIAPEKPAPEHDGCDGCKWYDKKENDEPCVNCRGTLIGGDEKPDLWERK